MIELTAEEILRQAEEAFKAEHPLAAVANPVAPVTREELKDVLTRLLSGMLPTPQLAPIGALSVQPESHLRVFTANPVVLDDADRMIVLDLPTHEEPIVTLPDPTTCEGRELRIKNYHAASARSSEVNVRSNRNHGNIEDMITANQNGAWASLVSDGTYWVKLQSYPVTDH